MQRGRDRQKVKSKEKFEKSVKPEKQTLNLPCSFSLFTPSRRAMTLAEVLITLGIIGIVAAMTIPTLIQKQQEQQTVVALKKAYSTISNAYTLAVQENGTPDNWEVTENTQIATSEALLNTLAPYLNITKKCGRSTGCWPDVTYKWLNNSTTSNSNFDRVTVYAKAQLADGSVIQTFNDNLTTLSCTRNYGTATALKNSSCAIYRVDINGGKQPNTWGRDLFTFYLTKYGVVPDGSASESYYPFISYCDNKSIATQQGRGCAAWVIYNENMDYMHCDGLSWTGKHKCD